jgi:hypothetical protein
MKEKIKKRPLRRLLPTAIDNAFRLNINRAWAESKFGQFLGPSYSIDMFMSVN